LVWHLYWLYAWGHPKPCCYPVRTPNKAPTDVGAWGEALRDTDIKHPLSLEGADLQGMVMMGTNFMTTPPDISTGY
jgi:hypothetical protein